MTHTLRNGKTVTVTYNGSLEEALAKNPHALDSTYRILAEIKEEIVALAAKTLGSATDGYEIINTRYEYGFYTREYIKDGVVHSATYDFWKRQIAGTT